MRFSISVKMMGKALHQSFCAIPKQEWVPIDYFIPGAAVAEMTYTPFATNKGAKPVRLIVRRVPPTPGSQLALFTEFSYHAFITDRHGDMLHLERDHRAHAEVENVIRDLKHGMGLNHLPSGRFGANAVWLVLNAIAHMRAGANAQAREVEMVYVFEKDKPMTGVECYLWRPSTGAVVWDLGCNLARRGVVPPLSRKRW